MKRLTTIACLAMVLMMAVGAFASDRHPASQPGMYFSESTVKASGDTVDLMGPAGSGAAYLGDFEAATARPGGAGLLPSGWTSRDGSSQPNYWHCDTFQAVQGTYSAWCGDAAIPACSGTDLPGGYDNSWRSTLEFRKVVSGPCSVEVSGILQYQSEHNYDYTNLLRRTAAYPFYELTDGSGQGLQWTSPADGSYQTERFDYTFTYGAGELYQGNQICVGFVFTSDGGYGDADCLNPTTKGPAMVDSLTVVVEGDAYFDDFESGTLGTNWVASPSEPCGDFTRVWGFMGDVDDCASNYSKLIAFIDDGLVVPGTGGWVGLPPNDYGPPGGYCVNPNGGLVTLVGHVSNFAMSPVMTWPNPAKTAASFAFDVYRHELKVTDDSPGMYYSWAVRSVAAGGDISTAGWQNRNYVYYGGPNYLRSIQLVTDLLVTGVDKVQVQLGCEELGYVFGNGEGTNATPAPYFDNVRFKLWSQSDPVLAVNEIYVANDVFPAIGTIDMVHPEANSCRFDMAADIGNITTVFYNDPGDSITIDATARPGAVLVGPPVMHWKFAVKNPVFTDAVRTALTPGQTDGTVNGLQTYNGDQIVPDRFNFDLPDTGMLFPGDVLHYYFSCTDDLAGAQRTVTAPANITKFGVPTPLAYPSVYTVNCLPSIKDLAGTQPNLLFWNDFGFRGGEDEWYGALSALGLVKGVHYDVFATHGPSSGVGSGLAGRATVSTIAGYTNMLYTCGDLASYTISRAVPTEEPEDDQTLLNSWIALGGRDIFLTGDNLATSLYGGARNTFRTNRMGITVPGYAFPILGDGDIRDNINNQVAPLVVRTASNPVFATTPSWIAYGGCFGINQFDYCQPTASAVNLAVFTDRDHVSTPWPTISAATLMLSSGSTRCISMNHDFMFVVDPGSKSAAPLGVRASLMYDVLNYFGIAAANPLNTSGTPLPSAKFGVQSYPNPFNPQLTLKYTLKNPGSVVMKVYNVRGELVKTLLNGQVSDAAGTVVWDGTSDQGSSVSSGVYFVETRSGGEVNVQKATMVK